MLLWDAAALRKDLSARQVAELPDGTADTLWAELAGEDEDPRAFLVVERGLHRAGPG